MRLSIEVYMDFICPWCLIGKRQLAQALIQLGAERPEVRVDVHWRGVQLLPALPVQGEDFHDFYLRRLGSEQAMGLRQAQVRQAAAGVGVALDFGKIPRMPNTADAHRLWQRACQLGSPAQLDELLERLFACHFLHGGDLGDGATLLGLAEAAGFGPADLVSSLQGDGTPFHSDPPGAAQQGVPSFVLGEGLTLSGAQPVAQLLASLRQALDAATGAPAARILVPAERVPEPGKRILIEAQGKSLVLFNVDGRFHAIDDGCPHQGASLCGGRLEGEVIQCLAHGLRFNLNTGYLLNSTQLKVGRYPVEQEGEGLSILIAPREVSPCSP
ncbi:DsbA family protein [Aeromonas media]|uniref:DsbA family protein n=1 Tax=Aeromonas media TaxID=651 RepID=UPI0029DD424E|nr:DsbA family protein [Aeromonas media]MDX7898187.1 DsbA family protein [Aeromonas media]